MVKKKKIRDEFQAAFEQGDDKTIKEMLSTHSWLLDEMSHEMDETMSQQHQVLAGVGVMEDEFNQPVRLDQIAMCLKEDFNITKSEGDILSILNEVESLNLVRKTIDGWALTNEGGTICDEYINKFRRST
ncbi:MAG: hypothetical protein JW891_11470 [Candidatus Lokiarchaeota archaeon]|nr:hypothetical protein [Candidatus Lokiarchaeota archaeon]